MKTPPKRVQLHGVVLCGQSEALVFVRFPLNGHPRAPERRVAG